MPGVTTASGSSLPTSTTWDTSATVSVAAICIGVGQALAVVLENIPGARS